MTIFYEDILLNQLEKYPAYRDSGVEWLGEIPAGWGVKKFKHLMKIKNGQDHKHVVSDSGYPVIGSGGQFAYASQYLHDGEALLLGRKGTIDKPLYVDAKFWTVDTMFYAIVNKKHSAKFMYFLSTTIPFSFYSTATALPSMTQDDLNNHKIFLPSLPEQNAIANFLDEKTAKIDTAIAQKQQMISLLKERKQILIQNAVTKGINPDVKMKDSGVEWIGEIPEGWEVTRLKYIFIETNERTKTGREVLFSLRMEQGLVPHNDVSDKYLAEENLIDYKIVQPGQMVMNRMRAAIGIFGLANNYGLVSPDYAVFNVGKNADPEYFLRLFKTILIGTQFRLNSKGLGTGSSGFMRLYTENFGDIKVPLPPIEEQIATVTHIETQSAKIDTSISLQQQQIAKLKEYKSTLIDSAVTGKIKVG